MPVLPESRQLYNVSSPLTNISTAYVQDQRNFVADRIFPVVGVAKQASSFYRYKKEDWFRSQAGVRAPATESPGGGWELDTDNYYAPVYSIHKDVDDQTRANADTMFNLDRDATQWVTTQLLIKRDRLFVDRYLKTGVWGKDRAGVASAPTGSQFLRWNVAGSTPIQDINNEIVAMAAATGLRPNTLVIGPDVWTALANHADILDRIKYTTRGIVTEELIAALFNVDRIVVTWASENIAPMGAAGSFAFQNNKTALLVYAAPAPGLLQPTGGYIFAWTGLLGAGSVGIRMKRFRMEPIESDRIEGEMAFDMKIIGADLGVFFDAVVT